MIVLIAGMFVFLPVAKLQDIVADRAAWQWLCVVLQYRACDWRGAMPFVVEATIVGLYEWVFAVLHPYADYLLLRIVIYFGGAVLPFVLPLMLPK